MCIFPAFRDFYGLWLNMAYGERPKAVSQHCPRSRFRKKIQKVHKGRNFSDTMEKLIQFKTDTCFMDGSYFELIPLWIDHTCLNYWYGNVIKRHFYKIFRDFFQSEWKFLGPGRNPEISVNQFKVRISKFGHLFGHYKRIILTNIFHDFVLKPWKFVKKVYFWIDFGGIFMVLLHDVASLIYGDFFLLFSWYFSSFFYHIFLIVPIQAIISHANKSR